jgi:hypothetical protein
MDVFAINSEHFAHKPNFFPYFPVRQGKCRQKAGAHVGDGSRPSTV